MNNNTYAYVRVSSFDQNEDRQLLAMNEAAFGKRISTSTSCPARISTARIISGC